MKNSNIAKSAIDTINVSINDSGLQVDVVYDDTTRAVDLIEISDIAEQQVKKDYGSNLPIIVELSASSEVRAA